MIFQDNFLLISVIGLLIFVLVCLLCVQHRHIRALRRDQQASDPLPDKPTQAKTPLDALTGNDDIENRLLLLESAVQQCGVAILISDLDGSIQYANQALCQIAGLTMSQLKGKNGDNVIPGPAYQEIKQTVVKGQNWQGELQLANGQAEVSWHFAVVSPIKDTEGRVSQILAVLEDIADFKATELELTTSKRLLEEAERIAHLGSWEWSVDKDRYKFSTEMFRLMDMSSEEQGFSFDQMMEKVHPQDHQVVEEHRQKALYQYRPYNLEYRVLHQNGDIRMLNVVAEVERDERGNPVKILGIAKDITRQKQEALQQADQQKDLERSRRAALSIMQDLNIEKKRAEQALAELAKSQEELKQASEAAQASNESKSRFLAAMSHEIRTPMNGVVGMLDLLQQSPLDRDQIHLTTIAKNSSLSLLKIIDDILDFSKIEAGKMTVEQIPFNCSTVVGDVAELLSEQIKTKQLVLHCFIAPELDSDIIGDQIRIRQIMMNLLGNAIKFTSTSDVKLGRITLSVRRCQKDPRQVLIEVKDNGIGISQAQQVALFKPFNQASVDTHRQYGGTGLGLSISRRLCEIMAGEITCQSEVGIGSEFLVRLPLQACEATPDQQTSNLKGVTVQLALSDREIVGYLQEAFVHMGVNCQIVDNIEQLAINKEDAAVTVVLDTLTLGKINEPELESADVLAQSIGKRLVVLANSHNYDVSMSPANGIVVDGNPFIPGKLFHAIGVAADRISPDVLHKRLEFGEMPEVPDLDESERRGELLLIVEDNYNNQEVMQRQVNLLGYAARIADNGQQALNLMDSHRFGLIITDCHMPIMDGFEFTRVVREKCIDIPIIAATANAMQGEAENCLAAGMSDYISKPVELTKLRQMLRHWLPLDSGANLAVVDSDGSSRSNDSKVNADPVDRELMAEYLGDDEGIQNAFMQRFVMQSKPEVVELFLAIKAQKVDDIRQSAHKLKSSSKAIGAKQLSALFESLELAVKNNDLISMSQISPRLAQEFSSVCDYIDAKSRLI